MAGCAAASLVSNPLNARVPPVLPAVTSKNASRHSKMSPRGQNRPCLRTAALGDQSSTYPRIRRGRKQYGGMSSDWNWNAKLGPELQQELLLYKADVGGLATLL